MSYWRLETGGWPELKRKKNLHQKTNAQQESASCK